MVVDQLLLPCAIILLPTVLMMEVSTTPPRVLPSIHTTKHNTNPAKFCHCYRLVSELECDLLLRQLPLLLVAVVVVADWCQGLVGYMRGGLSLLPLWFRVVHGE
jgi:hypothetical protein